MSYSLQTHPTIKATSNQILEEFRHLQHHIKSSLPLIKARAKLAIAIDDILLISEAFQNGRVTPEAVFEKKRELDKAIHEQRIAYPSNARPLQNEKLHRLAMSLKMYLNFKAPGKLPSFVREQLEALGEIEQELMDTHHMYLDRWRPPMMVNREYVR